MRRVFAISLAIAAVMFTAGGVMAQETQQDGNDLLLKILKERNILTDQEFQEIKGQLAQERSEVDQQLSALDRSLADYLAKAGDSVGGNSTYVQNQGVTFTSGDGNWSIYFGGLIQVEYGYRSGDNFGVGNDLDPLGFATLENILSLLQDLIDQIDDGYDGEGGFDLSDFALPSRDVSGGFALDETRIDFGGMIFDPALSFYVQLTANNSVVTLLDAYLDWAFCDEATIRVGQFKLPYGRQHLVDESDRAFGELGLVPSYFRAGGSIPLFPSATGRDTGVMFHGTVNLSGNPDCGIVEWKAGLWNGMGNNSVLTGTETNLAYGLRIGFYPMGAMPYVEGDWEAQDEVKAGIAGSLLADDTWVASPDDNPKVTSWEVDAVLTWNGLYFTGEYFSRKFEIGDAESTDTGWYAQAGYFVIPAELEVVISYGMITFESDDKVTDWKAGVAYYFNGHEWKVVGSVGQITYSPDGDGDDLKDMFVSIMLQADW